MKALTFFLFFSLIPTPAMSGSSDSLHADKSIYVDIAEVIGPDGDRGTSHDLNVLISQCATRTHGLASRFHSFSTPSMWKNTIRVYDRHNIRFKRGYKKCNYKNALRCGTINKHWTILTHITVDKKYSSVTMTLYNERGQIISSSMKTTWGLVHWKPNWKITKTTDSGRCMDVIDPMTGTPYQKCTSPRSTSMHEEWPAEMKDLPPLIRPYHIQQAVTSLYSGITADFIHK